MKIVFLYLHFNYVNNCATNLYTNLKYLNHKNQLIINVNIFKLEDIARAIKNADLLVVDAAIFNFEHWTPGVHKSIRTPQWRSSSHYLKIQDLILGSKNFKILIAPFHDLHTPIFSSKYSNQEMGKVFQALIWMYERGVKDIRNIKFHEREKWMQSHEKIQKIYDDFTKSFPLRIEFLHSLDEHEFQIKNKSKYWDVNVPGMAYKERLIALKSARKQELKIAPFNSFEKVIHGAFKINSKLINTENSSKMKDEIRKKNFRFSISHSKVNWSDGSLLGYPVRKYFEIPALRSALVMSSFPGYEDYGFVDYENCIITDADDFGQVAKKLIKNDNLREKICTNGFDMVKRLHSSRARAQQITDTLIAISENSLIKASFSNGVYSIERK